MKLNHLIFIIIHKWTHLQLVLYMLNPEVQNIWSDLQDWEKLRKLRKLRIAEKSWESWELESDERSIGVENRCQENWSHRGVRQRIGIQFGVENRCQRSLIEPGGPLVVSAQVVRGGDTQLRLVWGQLAISYYFYVIVSPLYLYALTKKPTNKQGWLVTIWQFLLWKD